MATLREWFDRFTEQTGEKPEAIVFGTDDEGYLSSKWEEWNLPATGQVVPFDQVAGHVLDVTFDETWGGNDSPDLCAWSPSWVLFSDNYDGYEGLCWVPRNPTDHSPIRPGGG